MLFSKRICLTEIEAHKELCKQIGRQQYCIHYSETQYSHTIMIYEQSRRLSLPLIGKGSEQKGFTLLVLSSIEKKANIYYPANYFPFDLLFVSYVHCTYIKRTKTNLLGNFSSILGNVTLLWFLYVHSRTVKNKLL